VGRTRRGKATKLMAIADRNGLPIAIGIASGQRHEVPLVVDTLACRFVKAVPERLIGDRAYDSDGLDAALAKMGIEMIAPHHPRRRCKTQDGRPLRRHRRRWLVERLFSWLLNFRRLVTRYEHYAENFLGMLKLACAVILLRRL
jgi:transposase